MKIQNTKKQNGPYLHTVEKKTNNKDIKNKQLRVDFSTKSTINNILKHPTQTDKYNSSSIYQINYLIVH
jgi:hypothetical protein